jgi:hypothetical protein
MDFTSDDAGSQLRAEKNVKLGAKACRNQAQFVSGRDCATLHAGLMYRASILPAPSAAVIHL